MVKGSIKNIINRIFLLFLFIIILVSEPGCEKDSVEKISGGPTSYIFPELAQFPQRLNIPSNNPTTIEGVKLGRYLFYDGRLSGRNDPDSMMSCATCHIQSNGFECGSDHPKFKGHPFGLPSAEYPQGEPTDHVMLHIINTVYNSNGYSWNGGSSTIESVVAGVIVDPHEINGSFERTVSLITSIPMYKPMFEAAFGSEEVNMDRISKAIAQFVRTIIAYRFKFYKYIKHEAELTPSELHGYQLFYSEDGDCFHCHAGSLLMTTTEYYNNAKDTVDDPTDRYSVSGNLIDKGAYRAPSLINCEINGPYMHDGRFKTLDEVIDFYATGLKYSDYVSSWMTYVQYGGNHLNDQQKADLKAFLLTLTDHELLTDPAYSCPDDLGEWGVR